MMWWGILIDEENHIQSLTSCIFIIIIFIFIFGISLATWSPVFAAGGSIYITNYDSDTISVIDTDTNIVGSPIRVSIGNLSYAIAFDSTHKRMYVTNLFSGLSHGVSVGSVSVIDTNTNSIVGPQIPVGTAPSAIAFDSTHKRMYVINGGNDNVTIIDTNTNAVVGSPLPIGFIPSAIAFDSTHNRMYVTNWGNDSVSVIDSIHFDYMAVNSWVVLILNDTEMDYDISGSVQ